MPQNKKFVGIVLGGIVLGCFYVGFLYSIGYVLFSIGMHGSKDPEKVRGAAAWMVAGGGGAAMTQLILGVRRWP